MWLFVPVGVLILLVLTNDLHQRFFAFQKDFVNSASNYTRQGVQCNHRVVLCADYGSVGGAVSAMQIPDSRRQECETVFRLEQG